MERRRSEGGKKDIPEGTDLNCGDCNKSVRANQNALFCDLCEHWFHIGCQHVPLSEYKLYKHDDHKAPWFCKPCHNRFKQLRKENREIKVENDKLRDENTELKKTNTELLEQIKRLEELQSQFKDTVNKVDNLKTQIKQEIIQEVFEDLDERREKEEKKSNLIIYNVEEKTYNSRQERIDRELQFCEEVFQSIGVDATNRSIVEVRRIGKYNPQNTSPESTTTTTTHTTTNTRPRPLLVKMTDMRIKWDIIKNGRKLREVSNESISKVRIVPDLTKKEREVDKKLREELKAKKDAGETDWMIKKGKLQRKTFLQTN